MQTINRKGRLVETYSLILIDLIAVLGAYMTALLLRFGNVHQAISMPAELYRWYLYDAVLRALWCYV